MKVRALTATGDWTFGKGANDYKSGNNAVAQLIQTRLYSFLGDCFFDQGAGINWFGFLGGKDQLGLNLAISATIANTENVLRLNQLSVNLTSTRRISISYNVTTSFSTLSNTVVVQI